MPNFAKSLDDFTREFDITAGETGGDRDDSGNFSRGLKSSFANLKSTGKAAVGAVLGREDYLIAAKHDQEDAGRYYQGDTQDFTDIDSAGDFGDWLAFNAGNATGSVAQVALGGGIGGAVVKGIGKKLAETSLKAMGEQALKDLGKKELIGNLDNKVVENLGKAYQKKVAANLQRSGVAGGMLASGLPQHVGESASQMYGETGDIHTGAALVAGTLKASLDMLPIIREFDKFGLAGKVKASITQKVMSNPTRIKKIAKSLGGTMGEEGATEALQDAIGLVALEVINEEKDHFSTAEFKGLFNSFMAGAAGGAAFGLPSSLTQAYESNDPWFKQAAKTREDLKAKAKEQIKAGDTEGYENTTEQLADHNDVVQAEWENQQAAKEQEREQHLQQLEEKQNQRIEQAGINNKLDDALPTDDQIPFETELPKTLEPPQTPSEPISRETATQPLETKDQRNEKSTTYTQREYAPDTGEVVSTEVEKSKQHAELSDGRQVPASDNAGLSVHSVEQGQNQPSRDGGITETHADLPDQRIGETASVPAGTSNVSDTVALEDASSSQDTTTPEAVIKGTVADDVAMMQPAQIPNRNAGGGNAAIDNSPLKIEPIKLMKSGKPFKTRRTAEVSIKQKGLKGYQVVKVDGGYGVQKSRVVKRAAFKPTHQLDSGELVVAHPEEKSVWVDKEGTQWKGNAAPIEPQAMPDQKVSADMRKPAEAETKVQDNLSGSTTSSEKADIEQQDAMRSKTEEIEKADNKKEAKPEPEIKPLPKLKLRAKTNKMLKALDQSIAKDKRKLKRMKCG